jgi:hypothetical protein
VAHNRFCLLTASEYEQTGHSTIKLIDKEDGTMKFQPLHRFSQQLTTFFYSALLVLMVLLLLLVLLATLPFEGADRIAEKPTAVPIYR